MAFRAAVLTISDRVSQGASEDASGPEAKRILEEAGLGVDSLAVVPDEQEQIETALRDLATDVDLIVTTGGTGLAPRDVTPEATRAVIDREAPGLAEIMRAAGLEKTPLASLSRAVAGTVGATLIVNLPGSPRAVRESLDAILEVLPHALALLTGDSPGHAP